MTPAVRLSPRGVTPAGCGVPGTRSCKHTCPAASSRHLAALAKSLAIAKAIAARTSLFCLSSCQCSCQGCCSQLVGEQGLCAHSLALSRDIFVSGLSAALRPAHSFPQVPLLAAAAPGISSMPAATTSTSCCPDPSSQFHRIGEHASRWNQLECCTTL